jgi:hypothetical protein
MSVAGSGLIYDYLSAFHDPLNVVEDHINVGKRIAIYRY